MSRGQGKAKLKNLGLGDVVNVFGSVFRQEREKPKNTLNGQSLTDFKNRENAEVAGNSM